MGGKAKRARGGSRIFSSLEGGGDFQKIVENFVEFFFELCQSTVLSLFWPNFLHRRQNFEKTFQKRRFWALFGKFWPKYCVFSTRAHPFKTSIYWRQRRFYKFFRVHHQKWISQNSTKRVPLGRQGVEFLREGVAGRLAPFDFLLMCLFPKIIDSFSSATPFLKKCLKTPFLAFFHKFACGAENLVKFGSL